MEYKKEKKFKPGAVTISRWNLLFFDWGGLLKFRIQEIQSCVNTGKNSFFVKYGGEFYPIIFGKLPIIS